MAAASYFFVSWPWSQASEAIAAWQRFAPIAAGADVDPVAVDDGGAGAPRCRRSASTSARRRRCGGGRPLTRGRRLAEDRRSDYSLLVLRWAGLPDGGLAACHRSTRSSFFAKSDYFDRPVGGAAARG